MLILTATGDFWVAYGVANKDADYVLTEHHVADDQLIFELVDPVTRESLPFEHGTTGLAVQTSLEAEGML